MKHNFSNVSSRRSYTQKRKLLVKSELITKVSSNVLNTRHQKQHPIIVWGFMVISEEIMCAVSFLVPEL